MIEVQFRFQGEKSLLTRLDQVLEAQFLFRNRIRYFEEVIDGGEEPDARCPQAVSRLVVHVLEAGGIDIKLLQHCDQKFPKSSFRRLPDVALSNLQRHRFVPGVEEVGDCHGHFAEGWLAYNLILLAEQNIFRRKKIMLFASVIVLNLNLNGFEASLHRGERSLQNIGKKRVLLFTKNNNKISLLIHTNLI